ncbi:hypothetical protein BT69DRAFT_1051373 [Atractiella rhizophila]|nr:hypothetical protein BT69DRAFT_1051373 [Atractiella rhizophila]
MRSHTGEKPFKCTVTGCDKAFMQRSALTVHHRTHTGEKPHLCDWPGCKSSFSDSSSLARHRNTHSGEKKHVCKIDDCGKTFTRNSTLVRHIKTLHKEKSAVGVSVDTNPPDQPVPSSSTPSMDTPKCIPSQLAAPTTSTNVSNISAPVTNSKDTSGIQVMAILVAAMSQLSDSNGNNATTVASSS